MAAINGKEIAESILSDLKSRPKPQKFFAAILVGGDPPSVSFLGQKEKFAKELGVDFRLYKFSVDIKNDELREKVRELAEHKTCGGVIVQLPLPEHVNRHYVLNVIPREKDVDVLSERALGAFYAGRNPVFPPAVGTVERVIQDSRFSAEGGSASGGKLRDSRVMVVGRGLLVGKPVAVWLLDKVRELVVLGSKSNLQELRAADLVISGVGEPGLIKPEMLRDGAGVIDFGYGIKGGKVQGDLDVSSSKIQDLGFYTPTPGGTGPILVAKVFDNFYTLCAL